MPYVDNRGVRIHYEVEGEGPPLVLQHGFAQSMEGWYLCGYVDALKSNYRLVLIDARGHGKSDKPHDRAAYTWPVGATDVLAVLDALDIHRSSFWGYSMGGGIGLSALTTAPERIAALVAGGATAEAENLGSRMQHVDGSDPEAFVAAFESLMKAPLPPELRAELLASDTRALAAAMQDRPSFIGQLSKVTTPCLLYVGEQDFRFANAQATAQQIPNASFKVLPGLDHPGGFIRSDLVLPLVLGFLEGVTKERQPSSMEPTH